VTMFIRTSGGQGTRLILIKPLRLLIPLAVKSFGTSGAVLPSIGNREFAKCQLCLRLEQGKFG
jgi:hypothetical protein